MTYNNLSLVDKNIAPLRRSGCDIRNEMRDAREKTRAKNISHEIENNNYFDENILANHAQLIIRYQYAWIIGIISGLMLAIFHSPNNLFVVIAIVSCIVCFCNVHAARYFLHNEYGEKSQKKCARWHKLFFAIQIAYGLVWCFLFVATPYKPFSYWLDENGLIATIVLMAVAILSVHNLRFGIFATTFPSIVSFSTLHIIENGYTQLALPIALFSLCILFEYLATIIRKSTIRHLHSKAVKDQLIMELEQATIISDIARRRAEEANLAKSRFLATISHELRTPLNAIIGFSQSMHKEIMGPLDNSYYKEYVTDIFTSGSHLLKLINDILDLSRIEAGRYEMSIEPTSLCNLARECQQMIKIKAKQKRISIDMQLYPNLPNITADVRSVRQIILNLLSNAVKFTPEDGHISIEVGQTQKMQQYICINDSGPGIPEEEIPLVLSSFGQGSIAIKSAEQGTGLGLPIVQALTHMHDGEFFLESKLRQGTKATVLFPPQNEINKLAKVA